MGTYRASRSNENNADEVKNEKEDKKEATAKALDIGLETGLDIYTAGAFSKAKNAITSVPIAGKFAQKKWDKAINKAAGIVSNTPVGDIAKKMNDAGITDTARGIKDTYNMASGAGRNNNSSLSNSFNKGNLLNGLTKLNDKSSKSGNLFGSGSFNFSNLFSFKTKLIIAGCFAGFLFFIMLFMTVFAEPDDVNLMLTNNTELSTKGALVTVEEIAGKLVYLSDIDLSTAELNNDSIYVITVNNIDNIDESISTIKNILGERDYYIIPNDDEDINTKLKNEFRDKVLNSSDNALNEIYQKKVISGANINSSISEKLYEIAYWYINNVDKYSMNETIYIPLIDGTYRKDCSGFAVAYMSYVAGVNFSGVGTLSMVNPNDSWAKKVSEYGWKAYTSDQIGSVDNLQLGDVLIADDRYSYSKLGQHAEVYVSSTQTFGWGSKKTKYPSNISIRAENNGGHIHFRDSIEKHDYITVYRYEGA